MSIFSLKKNNYSFHLIILFTLVLFLAINQFLFNRSLWIDEAMLANNILSRGFIELLYPLDDYQVAPPGYLWVLKLFSLVSKSEFSLRFISLFAFCCSLYFFYMILDFVNLSLPVKVFLISLFGFNYHTIYYASELKPYMIDLFVIVFLTYYAVLFLNKIFLADFVFLIFCIILTYISYITFAGVFIFFILFLIQQNFDFKKIYLLHKKMLIWFFLYAIAMLFLYVFFIHNHPHKAWMLEFWEPKNVFIPKKIELIPSFLFEKLKEVFFQVINHGKLLGNFMIVIFMISPIIFIIRRKMVSFIVLLFPVFIHLILSYFRIYPVASRLVIYWMPLLLIVIGISLDFFITKLNILKNKLFEKTLTSFIIISIFLNFLNRNSLVYKHEEIKTCINYLNDNHNNLPSLVFVYYGARPAFEFYKSINFIKADYLWFYGNNYRNQPEKYIDEINQFLPPFLILFSHVHGGEMQQLIEYISQKFEVKLLSQDYNAYLYQVENIINAKYNFNLNDVTY